MAVRTGGPADARALRVGRVAVLTVSAGLLAAFVVGLALWAARAGDSPALWTAPDGWSDGRVRAVLGRWGLPVHWYVSYFLLLEAVLVIATAVAVSFVLRGALSWFRLYLTLVLILFATAGGGVPLVVADLYPAVAPVTEFLQGVAWIALFPLAYVFPDGRFVPRWSRWLALGWAAWLVAIALAGSEGDGPVETLALMGLLGSCVAALIYRYVRVSGPVERLQIRWVIFAIALRFGYNVLLIVPPIDRFRHLDGSGALAVYAAAMLVSYLVAAALPAAIAIAVVRHRLFDIDVVISRTLVYAVLTAFVVGAYALVVGGVGALWHDGGDVALPLIATGLVAVVFSPLREQVQRRVERLVYGERSDPYGVLSRLGRQLSGVVQPDEVGPTIVRAVAGAIGAPYVAIVAAGQDVEHAGAERFPLAYRGEALGELVVGGPLTRTDRRLLTDLADHCGAALYAAQESARTRRLATDLQQARVQLVTAREEERRLIRRDLHDSLGPALGGQALTIESARALLATEPAAVDGLLRDLTAHSRQTLDEVRQLARRLRPPALDELGLAGALAHLPEQYAPPGVALTVEVEPLPPLPAAVEVAVYRIVHEALTNVVRHAGAATCRLTVAVAGDALAVAITDDGRGIAPGDRAGVGTASMRERAEELGGDLRIAPADGGGTTVHVTLPLLDDLVERD